MSRLNEWFIHRKDFLTFLTSIVVSTVLIFSSEVEQVHVLRTWTVGGFGYLLEQLSVVSRYRGALQENQWLRRENARLMLENSRLREAAYENQRLRELLDFKRASQLDLVPASVVGQDENGFVNAIVLTSGAADSITKNMAVVTSQGLVGKVYSVNAHHSVAQILLDRNFRVSAMVQRSRVMGIVKWTKGNRVVLAEVGKRADVVAGDTVVTSGVSTIFPGGVQIGRVTHVDASRRGMFLDVVIEPMVDFSKLEEVFIVRKLPLLTD